MRLAAAKRPITGACLELPCGTYLGLRMAVLQLLDLSYHAGASIVKYAASSSPCRCAVPPARPVRGPPRALVRVGGFYFRAVADRGFDHWEAR